MYYQPCCVSFTKQKKNNNAPVTLWGSGTPMREFLFVDDLAAAVLFALENTLPDYLYNVGTGIDLTIKELAETIQSVVGHTGAIDLGCIKTRWHTKKVNGHF